MEKTINITELQELKAQFNLINEKLEKQIIINETLIKESMKQKLSFVEKTFKLYVIADVIVAPLLIALLVLYNAPLALWLISAVALIVELVLYRREYRKLNTKELMTLGHIDAVERVAAFKKNCKKITYVMLIPSISIFVLFVGMVTGYEFDKGTVIYYSIFVLIASIWGILRTRKVFSKLDYVLSKIKELRSE